MSLLISSLGSLFMIYESLFTFHHLPDIYFAKLHFIRTIYSVVDCPGYRSALTAWQVGRRRSIFQQRIEYRFWPSRHGKRLVEDYYWRRSRLHAFCADAFAS